MPRKYVRKNSARPYNTASEDKIKEGIRLVKDEKKRIRKAAEIVGMSQATLQRKINGTVHKTRLGLYYAWGVGVFQSALVSRGS